VTFTTRFRRPAAAVIGAFVGLAGAFAVVTPASASTAELTAAASCTDTGWKVGWKLTTTGTNGTDGVFSNVEASITDYILPPGMPGQNPSAPQPPALTTFVDKGKVTGDGVFTEDQAFNPSIQAVELEFTVAWNDARRPFSMDMQATANAPKDCKIVLPTSTATPPPGDDAPPQDDSDTGTQAPDPTATPPGEDTPPQDDADTGAGAPDPTATDAPAVPLPSPTRTQDASGTGAAAASNDGGNSPGASGGLAVTGAATGTITGGAALLLAVGAALFVAARRRKVKFTA
jgi:hypothetical protein